MAFDFKGHGQALGLVCVWDRMPPAWCTDWHERQASSWVKMRGSATDSPLNHQRSSSYKPGSRTGPGAPSPALLMQLLAERLSCQTANLIHTAPRAQRGWQSASSTNGKSHEGTLINCGIWHWAPLQCDPTVWFPDLTCCAVIAAT